MGKKKSAAASLEKLSRGLTRETPATRAQETTGENQPERSPGTDNGGGEATQEAVSKTTATAERPRRRTGRPRTKPDRMVRVSVDLPRPDHKFLRDFAYDAESDGMSVMRTLLEEMRGNEELAERVLDRLAGG
ncbi:MAG: hypothetical protein M3R38_09250 [Actinomycetota bacterium]|nr:hypothetical protein [Actinomycetota bacterium]